ncbi:hypothetical protein H2279_07045 [Campylobacter sp. B0100352/1]|uniref:hypothetical protein n=1 Tax=Campylobacter sp. B0100352/1 TaxID=2735783 RepID=UPI001DD67F5D|nr:hypothetical protein [Campylobacter sp. B0100352/1]
MKKMKKIILAARDDGFGERMCCLLNAMYISKKTSFKFGFTWKDKKDSLVELYTQTDKFLTCSDTIPIEDVFSKKFIKKYHYDNFDGSPLDKMYLFYHRSINDLSKKPYEYSWGWRSCQANLSTIFSDVSWKEYQDILNQCWNEIEFSDNFKDIIDKAYNKSSQLKEYVGIHIRSGDLIFEEKGYARWVWFAANKALSFHLALEILSRKIHDNNIVIFTDDIESGKKIADYINKKRTTNYKCILAYELFDTTQSSSNARVLFEIVLMSKAIEIYSSGDSGFSRMASFIGKSKVISVYKLFNLYQQLSYLNKNLKKLILNKHQMSYSYFLLFLRSREKSLTIAKQIEYLKKGYEWNKDNYIFILCEIDVYLCSKNFDCADKLLEDSFNKYSEKILNLLLQKSYDLKRYDNFILFSSYAKYKNKNFKNINLMQYILSIDMFQNLNSLGDYYTFDQITLINLLLDNYFKKDMEFYFNKKNINVKYSINVDFDLILLIKHNITARFFNRLDYKIGKRFIESNSIKKIIFLIPDIYIILRDYKSFLKDYIERRKKDNNLKIPPIKDYNNYENIPILRQHLSYKIGRIFIILYKSKFKWKMLFLFYYFTIIYVKYKISKKKV